MKRDSYFAGILLIIIKFVLVGDLDAMGHTDGAYMF